MPGGYGQGDLEWGAADAAAVLSLPTPNDHKYSRGTVSLRTGSRAYPGAAALTVEGAWRAGVGMVMWHGDPAIAPLVMHRRPETVIGSAREPDAAVLGSGVDGRDRGDNVTGAFRARLRSAVPTVIDAGALDLVTDVRGPVIATPHEAELAELRIPLGLGIDDIEGDPLRERLRGGFRERLLVVRETAVALGGVVLLKGAETIVATPGGWWTVVRAGTPWLATAGTGDVLAGAMGALVAGAAARRSRRADGARRGENDPDADAPTLETEELGPIAATAAWLHGTAGRLAAGQEVLRSQDGALVSAGARPPAPGHPITALDVAERLPESFALALAAARG
ncbi:ADP-dependent NAD(P)H-hydrate dehydratase [Microbacterium halophytorum]|uniref:ADP-dependent NAD(P)H-hydrate dehydratase n=1 Tax=Microbacterium halophytorum TaxID=2067568 RepID=UPI000CFB871B|nr:ADP/ATP-dependent (S)-NAD(P)H-hydrate dehydratase [Microbacterium halophytorum]